MKTEPLFIVGMQVVEHDIYGFPIKDKGILRIRTIIPDSLRKASIINDADVDKQFSTLKYVALSICRAHYNLFIPLNIYHENRGSNKSGNTQEVGSYQKVR